MAENIKTAPGTPATLPVMSLYTRINKILGLIEDNLAEPVSPPRLAREAGMSLFHFQRTFRAMTGHSCMRYVRRRRMTWAAERLREGHGILDTALDCQFESQEAFTRAFKAQFGITPGQCRKTGAGLPHVQPRIVITEDYVQHRLGGLTMEPTLRSLNAMTLVGVTAAFVPEKTNMTVIPRLWGLLRERAPEIGNPVPGPAVGVINCLPAFDAGDDSDGKTELVYMAALPVAGVERLPEGLWATTIAPADYAVFRTSVANDQVNKTIDYAYGAWLPKSGYDRGEGPELEFYAPDFHPIDRPEFDYAIPVRRK